MWLYSPWQKSDAIQPFDHNPPFVLLFCHGNINAFGTLQPFLSQHPLRICQSGTALAHSELPDFFHHTNSVAGLLRNAACCIQYNFYCLVYQYLIIHRISHILAMFASSDFCLLYNTIQYNLFLRAPFQSMTVKEWCILIVTVVALHIII